jgi:DNA-binding transcriptional MerR regulator
VETFIRIQAAAAQLGVSVETIRRYERRGLIPPAVRNRAGQRVFTSHDPEAIRRVIIPRNGRDAGE